MMMSMKRNILKKNLSEDLTWANFFKNEAYLNNAKIVYPHLRSMHSTPERK